MYGFSRLRGGSRARLEHAAEGARWASPLSMSARRPFTGTPLLANPRYGVMVALLHLGRCRSRRALASLFARWARSSVSHSA
jgi:hypothetical protein